MSLLRCFGEWRGNAEIFGKMIERAQHRIGGEAPECAERAKFHRVAEVAEQRRMRRDARVDPVGAARVERLAPWPGTGLLHRGTPLSCIHDPIHALSSAGCTNPALRAFAPSFDKLKSVI